MTEYGLQLYSVRDITGKDLDGALAQVAALGYKYVEFAGFFGIPAEEIKAMLDKYGLVVSGTHTGWREIADHFEETVAYHKAMPASRNFSQKLPQVAAELLGGCKAKKIYGCSSNIGKTKVASALLNLVICRIEVIIDDERYGIKSMAGLRLEAAILIYLGSLGLLIDLVHFICVSVVCGDDKDGVFVDSSLLGGFYNLANVTVKFLQVGIIFRCVMANGVAYMVGVVINDGRKRGFLVLNVGAGHVFQLVGVVLSLGSLRIMACGEGVHEVFDAVPLV